MLANVDAIVDRFGGGADISTPTITSPPRQPTAPTTNNGNVDNNCKAIGNRVSFFIIIFVLKEC